MIEPKFAGEIIEYLIKLDGEKEKFINLFLAIKSLAEVRNRSLIASTADKLLKLVKDRAIADNDKYVQSVAVKALASNFKDDPDTLPLLKDRAIADNDRYVRCAAVQALANKFKDEPGMFEVFYNCAVNDPFKRKEDYETNPRQVALLAIIEQYPDHPQTLPLLRDKAENDADEKVREFAQNKLKELKK
jgi:HEAT repeat protein